MFKGEDIKKKRKSLRLSAEALAIRLQVSKENIYKWEKGTRPNGADYVKIEKWLDGKLENVPHETGDDRKSDPEPDDKVLLRMLMQQMNNLMQTQNNLLQRQQEQVVEKIDRVDTNLIRALQGVSKLVLHVESAREVVLDSLNRIEKKPPGALKKEAGKIMDQLEDLQQKHGIGVGEGM